MSLISSVRSFKRPCRTPPAPCASDCPGQVPLADAAELDVAERDDQREEQQDGRDRRHQRVLHHPAGQLVPEAVFDFLLGLGAAQEREAERIYWGPRIDRIAGRTVIERNAASATDAIAP